MYVHIQAAASEWVTQTLRWHLWRCCDVCGDSGEGEIKDNCNFGDQTVEYVVQAALRNSPYRRCLLWRVESMVPK